MNVWTVVNTLEVRTNESPGARPSPKGERAKPCLDIGDQVPLRRERRQSFQVTHADVRAYDADRPGLRNSDGALVERRCT